DYAGVALFTCVGLFISILASQVQRVYYRAQTLSARLETIIEAIPDTVVIYDPQGNVIQWSPATRMRATNKTTDSSLSD
ncbi:PAS domain-containing protein, partial [Salmonella sp. SAL04269]|uniref:PAS domain-containing protein n=1 Tax=Salmonella sp. SAL04269 TaxID=3159847 RepID=UPI00397A5BF5